MWGYCEPPNMSVWGADQVDIQAHNKSQSMF